jgi:acyl carrier protein
MLEQMKEIICEFVEVEKGDIRPESRFVEDLGFTSFDFMVMLGEMEERFDVEIDQTELVDIRTVKEAVDYIESIQNGD